ncbi:MAG: peptide ABC transporter substrate-binding protein [Anaerolineales bacterium]
MLMKRLRWQILVVVITLVVVGVLLLIQQPVGTVQFAPQPVSGGVYSEALVGSLGRLNPLLDWENTADRDVNRLIFSGLIRFDANGLPRPDVAESWGVNEEGTIYNFTLRENAYWHDGEPITSDDVIFTIDRMKSAGSLYPQDVKDLWSRVEVTRLNEKNLKFTIPEPFAPFLDYLTFGLLPRHILEAVPPEEMQNAEFNIAPVGSGPYQFDQLLLDEGQITGVVLKVYENYYGQVPYIPQVVFRYYPTPASALQAYEQGDVLAVSRITPDVLADALENPTLSMYTSQMPQISMVLLNLNNPEVEFLSNANVRRALLLGLNRQQLISQLLSGQAIIADGPILPGSWAYYESTERVPYDPEAAIALLKAEEYIIPAEGGEVRAKENQFLRFTLLHPDDEIHTRMAEIIQTSWLNIGVQVDLQAMPYDQMVLNALNARSYHAALVDLNLARTPDPDPYPFWHQSEATGGQNYSQWDNRTASEYLEQARVNTDYEIRKRLYRNFQVIFAKELPALPLFYPVYTFGVDAQVQDVQVGPLFDISDRFSTIAEWNLVQRRSLEQVPQETEAP